ncbi:MAG: GNAT family N-acetyltransferase [Pseudomonadota bacterium]
MTGPETALGVENLAAMGPASHAALGRLRLPEWQEEMAGGFAESLATWHAGPPGQILGLCFLLRAKPVGMTLFKRPPLSPDWTPADAASLHGLKIAEPWQGRGWGHHVLHLAVTALAQEWPHTARVVLAVDAGNASARAVYRRFGMTDRGPVHEGRLGREHRLEIALHTPPPG